MQGYNVIVVIDPTGEKLLFCKRGHEPYLGLFNLVGGKIEPGEDGLAAAYRELEEETSITRKDILLTHLLDFVYHLDGCTVEVYVGKLFHPVEVSGEENELLWQDFERDFFNMSLYAGEGNMGHIIEHVKMARKKLGL